jgi:hypothetical protein
MRRASARSMEHSWYSNDGLRSLAPIRLVGPRAWNSSRKMWDKYVVGKLPIERRTIRIDV